MTTSDERAEQERRTEYEEALEEQERKVAIRKREREILGILDEARRLEDNLTAVQARCTQQEEEIRRLRRSLTGANTPIGEIGVWTLIGGERTFSPEANIGAVLVGHFMRAFGQALPTKPTIPSDDVVKLRLRLIAEEFFELLEAAVDPLSSFTPDARMMVNGIIDDAKITVDLPEFVDALADLDYVIEGTRLACGVNGKAIAEAVHRANMAKVGGPIDANGKVQKPEGWTPPDIKALLVEQGWEP